MIPQVEGMSSVSDEVGHVADCFLEFGYSSADLPETEVLVADDGPQSGALSFLYQVGGRIDQVSSGAADMVRAAEGIGECR